MATAADFLDALEDLVKCVLKNLDLLFVSWKKPADRCANSASPDQCTAIQKIAQRTIY